MAHLPSNAFSPGAGCWGFCGAVSCTLRVLGPALGAETQVSLPWGAPPVLWGDSRINQQGPGQLWAQKEALKGAWGLACRAFLLSF